LGILKNWKLEYFANPGKLVIGIFGILGKLEIVIFCKSWKTVNLKSLDF